MRTTALAVLLFSAGALRAGPVCALIDPEETPRAAILEAKLLAAPGVTWVERASLDAVLREQKLQAAFGAQGVADRVRLGRLVKADILVLVRTRVDPAEMESEGVPKRSLEVVVSETAGGLRLLVRNVPLTTNLDADVEALRTTVNDGIKKHGEQVKAIVAVPPFVNRDLGAEYEHLKGAYAKLAESAALARAGTVVVELEEAQALAKELALAAPGTKLDRPAPIYLLGEFRNEGRGEARTVTLKLHAEQGGKPIGSGESVTVAPADVIATLQKWAGSTGAGGAVSTPDAKAEAERLAKLASMHLRLGNLAEAIALTEAALLLDPNRHDLHAAAAKYFATRVFYGSRSTSLPEDKERLLFPDHYRGLHHFELFVRSGVKLEGRDQPIAESVGRYFPCVFSIHLVKSASPEHRAAVEAALREHRDVHVRLLPLFLKSGTVSEIKSCLSAAYGTLPLEPEAAAERLASLLLQVQDREVYRAGTALPHVPPMDAGTFEKFIAQLESGANADFKPVIAELRKKKEVDDRGMKDYIRRVNLEQEARMKVAERRKIEPDYLMPLSTTRPAQLIAELKKTPLRYIPMVESQGRFDPELDWLSGMLAAGPGIDVFWAEVSGLYGGSLFLMKDKGLLKPVFRLPGVEGRIASVAFDGRYVWASAERFKRNPVVLVLDPVSEKVHELTPAEGLPVDPTPPGLLPFSEIRGAGHLYAPRIVAVAPGKALLVGSHGRTWIANATFDPERGAKVKVFLEAAEAPEPLDDQQWKRTTVSFHPEHIRTLRSEPDAAGRSELRICVVRGYSSLLRGYQNQRVLRAPLIIDPVRETVQVFPDETWPGGHAGSCDSDGSFHHLWFMGERLTPKVVNRLYRVDYPGEIRDLGPLPGRRGAMISFWHEGRLHAVRNGGSGDPILSLIDPKDRLNPPLDQPTWWSMDRDGKDLRVEGTDLPYVLRLGVSSHYGFVALLQLGGGTRALCTVDFSRKGSEHPVPAVPAAAPLKHPEETKGIRSQKSETPATITFANTSGENLMLHWIDLNGQRVLRGPLADGVKREIQTFLTHVWLVTDRHGNAIELFRATEKESTHAIKAPAK